MGRVVVRLSPVVILLTDKQVQGFFEFDILLHQKTILFLAFSYVLSFGSSIYLVSELIYLLVLFYESLLCLKQPGFIILQLNP